MTNLKLSEAKAHLGKYAQQASKGDTFLISHHNKPVAKLGPADEAGSGVCPKLGLLAGRCVIADDFDAPLDPFEQEYYGQ